MNFLTDAFVKEYEEKMRKIVGLRPQVENIIDEVMTPDKKNLFLVGIGGTLAVMLPFEIGRASCRERVLCSV